MADETMIVTFDDGIEISMTPGHNTDYVCRCPRCKEIYTDDPWFFGQCPYCGYKKEK